MKIKREIADKIKKDFFKGKVIILTGARQVGKTTLILQLIKDLSKVVKLNADDPVDRTRLENRSFAELDQIFKNAQLIFIDEAQKVTGIGDTLKLLVDRYQTTKQIIATGSSSLNLLSNTQEPLTGRKFVHQLFGLSVREICPTLDTVLIDKLLPGLLVYGMYPEVFTTDVGHKQRILSEITSSYLYQDILELEEIRNTAVIGKLVSALALQIGCQVSLSELAQLVGIDAKTVERYIDLLEKNYLVFRLPPYSTNQRKTLSKMNKIYFYDLGIRNALINNFNPLNLRSDVGALWENFVVLERMKQRSYQAISASQYFWRTYDGAEVDLIEQRAGKLFGYEIKWQSKPVVPPTSWLEYPESSYQVVNRSNFLDLLKN